MRTNLVKEALKRGEMQLGTGFWQLRSPEVPKLLRAAGFDWAFVDCEHGNFDLETVQDLCRVSALVGFTPLIRVGDLQYSLVARSLDCGAQGIVFPRVESVELLERAVSWTKFPPVGIRGYGLGHPHIDYGKHTFEEIIGHFNEHVMVVLQIETKRAFEMRDELISVKGVDAVMVGPADLSISLGVPGDFQNPRMVDAMEKIVETCVKHGVAPGTQTRSVELAKFWKARGMKFLGCNNELGMLYERASQIAGELKG
jgi:2-keto-3-deoxy-L-rhamnonate aldolase RhmA